MYIASLIFLFFPHDCLALKRRTLKNGTTTACYFATIHTDASLLLGELAGKTHATKETHIHIQNFPCDWLGSIWDSKYKHILSLTFGVCLASSYIVLVLVFASLLSNCICLCLLFYIM